MKVRRIIPFLILLASSSAAFAGDIGVLSLALTPTGTLPVGESSTYFGLGGGGGISPAFTLASFPLLSYKLTAGYSYLPLRAETALSLLSVGGGIGVNLRLSPRFTITPSVEAGYYYGILVDGSGSGGGNLFVRGGVGASFSLVPFLSLGISADYTEYFWLYHAVSFSLNTSLHIPLKKGGRAPTETGPLPQRPAPLELTGIVLESVFPVLHTYYDANPVGRAVLRNNGSEQVTDVSVGFYVERYMDNPKQCATPEKVDAGGEVAVDLYALFTDEVLEITEGTKVSAKLVLEYRLGGESYAAEHVETLRMFDRNAMTWDDDRKAAAFVTAKDPMVLEFAKNVAGWTKGSASRAVNANLSMAIGIHEALRLYGLTYVVDPTTPFEEFSQSGSAVDFLQFPRQTLTYTAGDCDDLSILYSALMESVGIETAFVTIPGHIFMAFSLDMPADEARRSFLRPDELIFRDDKAWVPLEITKTQSSFLEAWEVGAKEWRENEAREQVGFFPIHASWQVFEPIGLPGAGAAVSLPVRADVVAAHAAEVTTFIDREIYPQVSKLLGQIRSNNNSPRYVNKLGVLYAKYGLMAKAIAQFQKTLEQQEFVPALFNLGNIHYLGGDMEKALEYYTRAAEQMPDNPKVLLGVARVNHELENYGIVKTSYEKLKALDPDLAAQFSYLSFRGEEASRAAEMSAIEEVVIWDDE